jgi:ABC-2 type transport system ATP-binding protein
VALGDRAATKVGGYSLGMRQRLALAAALLKDPALLVLDEPANGLDPAGMRDVRELLRRLGREGRTVFLSSHLLAEVEQTCDRVAIIDRGRAVLTSSVSDLLARPGGSGWIVDVAPGEVDRAVVALERRGLNATLVPGSAASAASVRITTGDVDGAAITEALAGAGVWLRGLRREDVHLEDLFLSLTGAAA